MSITMESQTCYKYLSKSSSQGKQCYFSRPLTQRDLPWLSQVLTQAFWRWLPPWSCSLPKPSHWEMLSVKCWRNPQWDLFCLHSRYERKDGRMHEWIYVYVWMYVCMFICMYVCIYYYSLFIMLCFCVFFFISLLSLLGSIQKALPADQKKWAEPIISYACRSTAISIAWMIQRVISAFHSAMRGGIMCSRYEITVTQ